MDRQPGPHFKELWSKLEISNDDFIRTTEPRQHHAVQYLWERMKESGYLWVYGQLRRLVLRA